MLRQSKPLSSSPGSPTSAQVFSRSQLLSLDWEGGADRYPVPGGVRRPPTPVDDLFLSAATRYPIERPTHDASSTETVSWYTDNNTSGPSSPGDTRVTSFASGEGLSGFERRRAVRERSPLAMNDMNDQGYDESMVVPLTERVRNDNDNQEEVLYEYYERQRRERTGCSAGQHTADVKRSLRQKLGRHSHATCIRCGQVFEVKNVENSSGIRRTLSLGAPLRRNRVE